MGGNRVRTEYFNIVYTVHDRGLDHRPGQEHLIGYQSLHKSTLSHVKRFFALASPTACARLAQTHLARESCRLTTIKIPSSPILLISPRRPRTDRQDEVHPLRGDPGDSRGRYDSTDPDLFPMTDSNARRRRRQCPPSKRRIEHQCGPNTTESSRLETTRDISTKPDPA